MSNIPIRDIVNVKETSEAFNSVTLDSYKNIFPIENEKLRIELLNIWIDDTLDSSDYSDQKKIKAQRGNWSVPVYGSFQLIDKATGKVVQKVNKYKLSDLPKLTDRNTFIWGGVEYQPVNLLRRKPGVYVRTKPSEEVEAFFNLSKGINFKLQYDPVKRDLYTQFGSRTIPAYSVMKSLGIPEAEIKKTMGQEVYDANYKKDTSRDTTRLHEIIFQKEPASTEEAQQAIQEYFSKTELDPDVAKAFIKSPHKSVSPQALLDASSEVLRVSRGESKPINSEAFSFKSLHTIEDFVKESFKNEQREIQRKLKRNLGLKEDIRDVLYRPALASPVKRIFGLNVIRTPEQTNPLHVLDESMKVTFSGEGGIEDEHQITLPMRDFDIAATGFLDPVQTPEGGSIGILNYLTLASKKRGNEIVAELKDLKTGKIGHYSPADLIDKIIIFPNQKSDQKEGRIRGVRNSELVYTTRGKADYEFPSTHQMFGISTNLVPFLHSIGGGKAGIGSKMALQATSLPAREAPLVSPSINGVAVHKIVGDMFADLALVGGVVSKVGKDYIEITDKDGKTHKQQFYKDFYLNDKNYLDSVPQVKEGDKIKKGDSLVEMNYIKGGQLALGTNLHVAYLPYRGLIEKDSLVMSESAAKKMTSEHVYQFDVDIDDDTFIDLNKFKAAYPSKIDSKQAHKLGTNGIIREGQTVEPGDFLAAVLQFKKSTPEDLILGRLSRGLVNRYKDQSLTWDRVEKGVVTDVIAGKKHISIFVKSYEPARVGDKFSSFSANKGTVARMIPDDQMPTDINGEPFDLLMNPTGVISRANPSQIYETLAGKVAKKTGKQVLVPNFGVENQYEYIKDLLKKNDIPDTESVIDPVTKKEIKNVLQGYQYILKLKHQSLDKASGRYRGVYSVLDQPVKGGEEGAKAMDPLSYYALLAHGSKGIISDVQRKSTKNDELWRAMEMGESLPPPKPTFAYDTFLGYLKAMGVNVKKNGTQLKLLPLTSNDIKQMSNGSINSAKMLDRKLRPEKDGLFDPVKTGGLLGTEKWTHIDLVEPMPNPILEKSIIQLTGLSKSNYDKILSGELYLNKDGEVVDEKVSGALSGGKALIRALDSINVDSELKDSIKEAEGLRGNELDKLNRKIRSLDVLKTLNIDKPSEAYILKYLPVLPPKMRPIYPLSDGSIETSDFNYLYRDIIMTNNLLQESKDLKVPEQTYTDLRSNLYNSVKALYGLADPVSSYFQKRTGLLPLITGPSPKMGYFHSKLFNKEQDLVGRSVIIPSEGLHVDEIGLPERIAWKIFQPYVIREYTSRGYNPLDAAKRIEKHTPEAKQMLELVMNKYPVLLNRAPSLHKYNIMAYKPKLVEGEGLQISPLISPMTNHDYDGDTMMIHVPISPEAIREAWTMLPSQHTINPSTGKFMLMPDESTLAGIIGLSNTAEGRAKLNKVMPAGFSIKEPLNKKLLQALMVTISKKDSVLSAKTIDALKVLGDVNSFTSGYSLKLNDLKPIRDDKEVQRAVDKFLAMPTEEKKVEVLYNLSKNYDERIMNIKNNNFVNQVTTGVRGAPVNLRQMIATPIMYQDVYGKPIPMMIEKGFSEGLNLPDYIIASKGARKGLIDKGLSVKVPGELSKTFSSSTVDYKITEDDCGTLKGLEIPVSNPDAMDRYLCSSIVVKGKTIAKRNQLVDPELIQELKKQKQLIIEIRSPLYCKSISGVCIKCAGLGGDGRPPKLGEYYGIYASQSLGEPTTQAALSTPHKGGVVENKQSGLNKIRTLLEMPKSFPGQAYVAEESGKITKIEKSKDQIDIYIDKDKQILPGKSEMSIHVGDTVKRGDQITKGLVNPSDVYRTKGLDEYRKYLHGQLLGVYRENANIRSNVVESLVAATSRNAIVLHPGDSNYYPGDFIRINQAESDNKKKEHSIPLEDSEGKFLAEDIGPFAKGTLIDNNLIRQLKQFVKQEGKEILVHKNPMTYDPIIRGIEQIPLAKEDWLTRMSYRELKNTLEEGVARGWSSDLAGYSPIPSYITNIHPKKKST